MAAPHGIAGQFGYKTESVVGTGVTVTKFLPILSESIKNNTERIESKGMRAGRRVVSTWKAGRQVIGGGLELELWNLDVAVLWKHIFGGVTTTGAGPYTHTYSPADLTGDSMTIQIGRPDIAGTVQPFTYAGCKVRSWSLKASAGDIATLSLDVSAMSEATGTALATASYDASLAPFVFTEASLSIAGSAVGTVKNMTLTGNNALGERFRLGSATAKESLETDVREYMVDAVADFEGLTHYARIAAGTEVAVVATYSNGTQSMTITMNCRTDGDTPVLSGPDVLEQPLKLKCVSGTSDAAAITAVLINGESTAA